MLVQVQSAANPPVFGRVFLLPFETKKEPLERGAGFLIPLSQFREIKNSKLSDLSLIIYCFSGSGPQDAFPNPRT